MVYITNRTYALITCFGEMRKFEDTSCILQFGETIDLIHLHLSRLDALSHGFLICRLGVVMTAFLLATALVALAEMGDKTQLLAFLLAARFRQPVPIVLGILVATLANHTFAGAVGVWITQLIGANVMHWVLGFSFIFMGVWILVPDKIDEDDQHTNTRFGVFGTTVIAFFLAEMGDKTQIATVALSAKYAYDFVWVILGTTCGMMLANVPAVYLGNHFAQKLPIRLIHGVAAAIFVTIGIFILSNNTLL